MTILLTGGGTGGHITPLLAVARELKKLHPDCRIVYVGERGGKFSHLVANQSDIDEIKTIFAGKYRRYYGLSLWQKITDVKTIFFNLRDFIFLGIGFLQSLVLIARLKPDVILLKGGFVGVPVGFGAALQGRRFVTHDSDIIPGLANRLVGRWAVIHAVAQSPESYSYPSTKVRQVGVLVHPDFHEVDGDNQAAYKQQLSVPEQAPLLLVTGGSSGAVSVNNAMAGIVEGLLTDYPDLHIIHQVGKGKSGVYGDYSHARLQVVEFMQPMHAYTGAADVVVTRASANTVAELGIQSKAIIVIASPFLADGHQLKNAESLERQGVALKVVETNQGIDTALLDTEIRSLLDDVPKRLSLATKLHDITITDAAHKLAVLLLDVADVQTKR